MNFALVQKLLGSTSAEKCTAYQHEIEASYRKLENFDGSDLSFGKYEEWLGRMLKAVQKRLNDDEKGVRNEFIKSLNKEDLGKVQDRLISELKIIEAIDGFDLSPATVEVLEHYSLGNGVQDLVAPTSLLTEGIQNHNNYATYSITSPAVSSSESEVLMQVEEEVQQLPMVGIPRLQGPQLDRFDPPTFMGYISNDDDESSPKIFDLDEASWPLDCVLPFIT